MLGHRKALPRVEFRGAALVPGLVYITALSPRDETGPYVYGPLVGEFQCSYNWMRDAGDGQDFGVYSSVYDRWQFYREGYDEGAGVELYTDIVVFRAPAST